MVNEIPGYEFKTRAALSEMMYLLVTRAPATRAVPKKANFIISLTLGAGSFRRIFAYVTKFRLAPKK